MNDTEMKRVQGYLQKMFGNDKISVKRGAKDDMAEVFINDEFIATLNRDDDEGEVSFALSMAILEFDLDGKDLADF